MDDTSRKINPYKELIVNSARENRTINDTDGTMVNPE